MSAIKIHFNIAELTFPTLKLKIFTGNHIVAFFSLI